MGEGRESPKMNTKNKAIFVISVFAAFLLFAAIPSMQASPPSTKDWPMFQGNLKHTGVAYPGLNGITTPAQLWSFTDDNTIGPGSPVIADIDGGGVSEVLIGTANFAGTGGIYAFESDGTLKWKYQTGGYGTYDTPNIADIDGNGDMEIAFVSLSDDVTVLEDNGIVKWTVSKGSGPFTGTRSVIADVDGDGDMEVVAGAAGKIWCLDADGNDIWNASYTVLTSIAIADVDGDGGLEIIFSASGKKIVALNADGSLQWTGSPAPGQDCQVSLAVTNDLNDDGKPDVAAGSRDKKIYAYSGANGAQLWSYGPTVGRVFGIAVADINGDGYDEVVATATKGDGVESYVYVLNGANGALLWQYNVVGAKGHTSACTPRNCGCK